MNAYDEFEEKIALHDPWVWAQRQEKAATEELDQLFAAFPPVTPAQQRMGRVKALLKKKSWLGSIGLTVLGVVLAKLIE